MDIQKLIEAYGKGALTAHDCAVTVISHTSPQDLVGVVDSLPKEIRDSAKSFVA